MKRPTGPMEEALVEAVNGGARALRLPICYLVLNEEYAIRIGRD